MKFEDVKVILPMMLPPIFGILGTIYLFIYDWKLALAICCVASGTSAVKRF